MTIRLVTRLGYLLFSVLLFGCAEAPPRHVSSPPKVSLGAEQIIFEEEANAAGAIMDPVGKTHILVRSAQRPYNIHYIVVSHEGIVERSNLGPMVESGGRKRIDMVFDRNGGLHALVGDPDHWTKTDSTHLMLAEGKWQKLSDSCEGLVENDPDITCYFAPKPEDVKAPRHWEWLIFYGAVGGFGIPFYVKTDKLVLASAMNTAFPWAVVDIDTKLVVVQPVAVADANGNVYLAYKCEVALPNWQAKYAVTRSPAADAAQGNASAYEKVLRVNGNWIGGDLKYVKPSLTPNAGAEGAFLLLSSTYPPSGLKLGDSLRLRLFRLDPQTAAQLPDLPLGLYDAKFATGGKDRMHFLAQEAVEHWMYGTEPSDSIVYFELTGSTYSGFANLGTGIPVAIVSDNNGRALAIWQKLPGKQLVMRWIEPQD